MKQISQKLEVFRIWDIPICLDYSWFVIFFVYTSTIAVFYLPSTVPNMSKPIYWLLGIVTSLLIFASVLIHELGHALAARQEAIGISSITLHIFGGLAYLEEEPKTPIAELRIAAAGPMASFVLALIFYLLAEILLKTSFPLTYQAFLHLGTANFLIACFNLLPGFPMDGGRVLRAILWYFDKSYEKATRLTTIFGLFFAVILVIIGIVNLLGDYNLLAGFWTLLAGFLLLRLLYNTSPELLFAPISPVTPIKANKDSKLIEKAIKDFISKDFVSITPNITIAQVLKTYSASKTIPVVQTQQLHGILFITDVEKLTEKEQSTTFVHQIMKPVTSKHFVTLDLSIQEANTQLIDNDLGYVLVIDSNSLVIGLLSQKEIILANKTN